ncbi:MAG: DUF1206 domain-containing protein [Actinobacteria bacterium]|nr:DUF1206 domain-containing protein [Actinomycetota bacterium]
MRSLWIDRAAKLGLVARGVVYVLMGVLAIQLATGNRRRPADNKGAMAQLATEPFGKVALAAIALGLLAYALSCALGAIRGHGGKKGGESSGGERASDAGRAVVNTGLAVAAASMVIGARSSGAQGGGKREKGLTARALAMPFGVALVLAAAAAVLGFGLNQIRKGVTKRFTKGLQLQEASVTTEAAVELLGVAGYVARGIVFAIAGWFLAKAAIQRDPNDAIGIDGALAKLARAAYGPYLLGLVAAGLICFGLWSMVEARFRRDDG